jgi:hypothetical protein
MAVVNGVYCRPTDIVTANAAITASAADSGYPPSLLGNKNPAHPAKLTTTSGWFLFTFTAAQILAMVALIQHNLDAGLAVYLQANSSDSWASPPLSVAFTIPAIRADNFRWNVYLDLSAVSPRTYKYWRVYVSGTNSYNVAIGEVLLIATKRTLSPNIEASFTRELNHPVIEHKTDANVPTIYDLGIQWETIHATIKNTETGADDQETLFRSAGGRSQPFLFIQDPGTTEPLYVRRLDSKFNITFPWTNRARQEHSFDLEECGRGLWL